MTRCEICNLHYNQNQNQNQYPMKANDEIIEKMNENENEIQDINLNANDESHDKIKCLDAKISFAFDLL